MLFEIKPSQDRSDGDCNLNHREFESFGDSNPRSFDANCRGSKLRDPCWRRSPHLNYRESDSYIDLNSRPSHSNYTESKFRGPDSNYREFDSYRDPNSRPSNSNYGDPNSNCREFDSYRDLNSRPSNSNYREVDSYRDPNSQLPNPNNRDSNWRSPNLNHGGFDSYESYGDAPYSQQRPATPLRDMKTDRVLAQLEQLQLLLDRILLCQPTGTAKTTRMVIVALYPVVKESFQLYANICEVLALLLDRFFDMDYPDCLMAFEAYSWAAKQFDELILFYGWCKDIGVVRWSEYPEVQRVSDKMLVTLEEFLRDRGR